jgi:hypothetical protein
MRKTLMDIEGRLKKIEETLSAERKEK